MLHLSTKDFAGASKVSRWNDIVAEVFTPLETRPLCPDEFEGEIDSVQLGDVFLANVVASPATVARTARHAASSRERHYFFHLQLDGELRVAQDGREAILSKGDMVLCDSALPYTLEYEVPASTLVMIATPQDIKRRLPAPEIALGQRMSGSEGLSSTLSGMLASVWHQVKNGLDAEIGERVGANLLDMFATSCMDAFGSRIADSAVASARRSHIRCYIESNLKDPELTVASIAAAFRISPRYLHMLFAEEEETISGFIRRRRLEECKKRLADQMWRHRSITELAYAWGFNNTTHFARVFRERYGVSPREYRNAHLAEKQAIH
ncbi:MAG: helix-turn-helix domain-containing protein [Parvularculaceae bacterium]